MVIAAPSRLARPDAAVAACAALLAAAWLLSPLHADIEVQGFLPLHSFAESVSLVVSALVFGVAWNAHGAERSGKVVILACAFFAVALIDFAHLLSYPGMPDFVTPASADKSIFFWLCARAVCAFALLATALMPSRPLRRPGSRHALLAAAGGVALLAWWLGLGPEASLPRMFAPGEGLTPLKVGAEYALMALFLAAAALFYRDARRTGSEEAALLFAAAAISALSELILTLYSTVTDLYSLLGHAYKVVAYAFIYRAVFVASVRAPFEELEAREAALARAERIAHVGSWEADLRANRLVYSDEALRIHGLAREAFDQTLAGAIALAHPEDRLRLTAAINGTLYEGRPFAVDYRIVRPGGDVRYVHAEDELIRDAEGAPLRAFGITQDITERKSVEQALREEQQRLRLVTDNVPAMIAYVDTACRYRYANLRYRWFYARGEGPIEGKTLAQVLTPDTWAHARPRIEQALSGEAVSYAAERRGHDGAVRHVSVSLVPERDETAHGARGVVRGLYILVLDVTAQHQAEMALRESEAGLRHAQEMAGLAHIVVGPDGAHERWSDNWPRLIGLAPERLPRSTRESLDRLAAEDRERFRAVAIEAGRLRERTVLEYRVRRGDDALIDIRQTMEPLGEPGADGRSRWFITLQDVTQQKRAEERIRRLNRVYAVLSGINSAIVRIRDRQGLFDEACRIAVEIGGFRFAWVCLVDAPAGRLVPAASAGEGGDFLERLAKRLSLRDDAPRGHGIASRAVRESRALFVNRVEGDPLILDQTMHVELGIRSVGVLPIVLDGKPVAALGLHAADPGFFDEQEQRLLLELAGDIAFGLDHIAKEEKVRYLAYYDQLTGLANRSLLLERLAQHIAAARADGQALALVLVNLERFRIVNDTLGRQVGDELLRQIAARLRASAGDEGRVARIGADQFAIVIPRVLPQEDLAQRLRAGHAAVTRDPFVIDGRELRVSFRSGVALFPADGADADSLFRNAEAALKKARSGEPFVFYAHAMTERIAEQLDLENRLRLAVERAEFVLHYQPKFDLATRRITGAEALIRWASPDLGLVAPAKFIPMLEETGLIAQVGPWALARAVEDQARWRSLGLAAPRVSVNVSAVELRRPEFVAQVEAALSRGSQPAIDLEITESLLMEDVERSVEKLKALRELGVGVAIDDFGTGYSSLGYLARLPVQALKIDRSFIVTMFEDADIMTLVSTIVSLAHTLQLKVIAEGVDAEAQAKVLRSLRCDEAQGYLFSKPVPAGELAAMLQQA